jgi:hypothetical protein
MIAGSVEVKMRLRNVIVAAVLAAGAGVGLARLSEVDPSAPEQVAYFRSEDRLRVFAWRVEAPITEDAAREIFARMDHTPGQISRGLVYVATDLPWDRLTLAPSAQRAMEMTVTPPFDGWSWMGHVNPSGDLIVYPGDS